MVRTKVRKEASLFRVVLTAITTVFIGVVVGFAHEVARPGIFGNAPSDADEASRQNSPLFLVAGSTSGSGWRETVTRVTDGAAGADTLTLTEGDLNQIAREYLDFTAAKEQYLNREDGEPHFVIFPETPVFATGEQYVQITVPFELHLFGLVREGYLVLEGVFDNAFQSPELRIRESWINSARLPSALTKIVVDNITASYAEQDADSPLVAGWKNLQGIEIANRQVALEIR